MTALLREISRSPRLAHKAPVMQAKNNKQQKAGFQGERSLYV